MNKNQKIAIGCGAVGCLGLLVIALAVGIFVYLRSQQKSTLSPLQINSNSNTSSNRNQNSNSSENANSSSTNENSTSTNSSSDSKPGSYSDDDKHKLFQAASMSQDADLLSRVMKKLGLFTASGMPVDDYAQFIKDHITWGASNTDFINSLDTPEKARAYVEDHLPGV